jgi:hypothetical protein
MLLLPILQVPDITGHIWFAVPSLALHTVVMMPRKSVPWEAEVYLEPSPTHGEKAIISPCIRMTTNHMNIF